MAAEEFIIALGSEIEDVDEETFLLCSQSIPSQNLGIIDDRASVLELPIGNRDFTVKQSPAVLNSTRGGGTTGAVVWKVTPRFAQWLASPDNILFTNHVLSSESIVLELGSGIAGIVPCMLAPMISRYLATDQLYALKLLRENVDANSAVQVGNHSSKKTPRRVKVGPTNKIEVVPLDWESDDVSSLLKANGVSAGVDMIVACDCIYNYALIPPFVQTCVDACRLRQREQGTPTVCLVAQQLRQPDVFEEWLSYFHKHFRTWRLPDDLLTPELRENSGFVVHLGLLREEC